MGHHCEHFVCQECHCLASGHDNGAINNEYCRDCALKLKNKNDSSDSESTDDTSESESSDSESNDDTNESESSDNESTVDTSANVSKDNNQDYEKKCTENSTIPIVSTVQSNLEYSSVDDCISESERKRARIG